MRKNTSHKYVAYQSDFHSTDDVHGPGHGCPDVEADADCSPELWPQRAGDHEVWATGGHHPVRGDGGHGYGGENCLNMDHVDYMDNWILGSFQWKHHCQWPNYFLCCVIFKFQFNTILASSLTGFSSFNLCYDDDELYCRFTSIRTFCLWAMNRKKFITWIKVTLHANKKRYLHCNEYARQGTGLVINSSM